MEDKKKDTAYLGIYLSVSTHEELKKYADEKEISMSAIVRQLIKDFLSISKKSA